jgi:glyoxylase-like metal-dependent hydrolase (beta-lactamase superfamily II)
MAQIRNEGKINDHTYLIDAVHRGMERQHAVYLLKSSDGGTCLIDAGTKDSARVIYGKLKALDAWPPDRIIFTHSHWDHTQGVEYLRGKATETGDTLKVFASEKAMPYLADQSFNICFGTDEAPYLDIEDVSGLKNGDRIDVGKDLTVTIVDTPGHMADHISVWDETTGNIIVGDAIGMKWTDEFIVSNPNSEFWNEADYLQSLETLKALGVKTIGLAHFGCLTGDEAARFLDDSVATYKKWMSVLAQHMDRIDDIPYLVEILWADVYSHMPDKFKAMVLPGLMEALEMAAGAYAKQHG